MAVSTELVTKDWTVCVIITIIVSFGVLACFNFDSGVDFPRIIREFHEDWTTPNLPIPAKELPGYPKASAGGEILNKLKELSRMASEGHDCTLSATERQAWHTQHPCLSRSELPAMYAARKHVKDISSNTDWDRVFEEYSKLHRVCMKRVGNITEHFLNKSNVSIPGCKFLVGEGTNGLGNKLLVTVSAVLYAIVSQRVLLMPRRTNLGTILCEPFVGSSWMLDSDEVAPGYGNVNTSWVEDRVFILNMNERLELAKNEESGNQTQMATIYLPPLVDAVVVASGWDQWQPRDWFYCSTEQRFLSEVQWVYLSGCLYSIPGMFASPVFRTSLKALFPDKMVTTRLLRSVHLPSDTVWSRFKHLNHAYFQQPDRRVAVQLRFYGNTHETSGTLVNDKVLDCVIANGILPNVTETTTQARSITIEAPITTVFIASLYPDLHDLLTEFYLRNPTESGEDVNLVQVTNHFYQSSGVEEDTEAMVEVLLLSVSDALLVTPGSTFGGLAHTYGGLTPWVINTYNVTLPESCERGQSVDDCQAGAKENYSCPNDPETSDPDPTQQDVAEKEPPTLGLCSYFGFLVGSQVLTNGSLN
ncbi:unnamed protein product [Calypogeia fissa]